jgi:arylsulfatase A-like enzyme
VEAGVRLVSIIWMYFMPNGRIANVWDNHGGTDGLGRIGGYDMLKEKYCIPPLDLGLSALIDDLDQRGLLDETLVVAVGEFGRTPNINKTQGRDHWGRCQSALLAGGGIGGGQVYGASDKAAAYPKDNPVAPEDLLATLYAALGLSPDLEIHDREGRPHRISDGKPIAALFR